MPLSRYLAIGPCCQILPSLLLQIPLLEMNQRLRWASSPGESGVRVLNIRVPSHYTSTISKCQSQFSFSFYTSVEHSHHQLHRRRCVRQVVSLPQLDPQEDLKVHILRTLIPLLFICVFMLLFNAKILFNIY